MAIGNLLVMTGGGPTAVLNATLFGIIREASKSVDVLTIKGALNGIKGIINDDLICLYPYGDAIQLINTPGTILGTSRYRVGREGDFEKIVATLKRHKITQLIMIGGNDTMSTALAVDNYLKTVGYPCKIVGVPKTVDNDLAGTDHAPGYGSAAKYVAESVAKIIIDRKSFCDSGIRFIETMGRNTGWIAAAASLSKYFDKTGPDFIVVPERPFDAHAFAEIVYKRYQENKCVNVVISEGVKLDGELAVEDECIDGFGHEKLGGVARLMAEYMRKQYGVKAYSESLGTLQRCGTISEHDKYDAVLVGREAVQALVSDRHEGGRMISLDDRNASHNAVINMRIFVYDHDEEAENYKIEFSDTAYMHPLDEVAEIEKKIPDEWLEDDGNGWYRPTIEFEKYIANLAFSENFLKKKNSAYVV